tara:strand:- start:2841 stop:3005 length:165 start_codon:yes stop_codon:yes gene_type:complete
VKRLNSKEDVKATAFATLIFILILAGSGALYGNFFFGNWKCGLIECRLILDSAD